MFFGRMLFITLPTSIIAVALVIYSISRSFHKSQSVIYRKKLLENRLHDRADLLKNYEHVKYHYPFRPRQTFTPIFIILGVFMILAFIHDAFYPFGIIIVIFSLGMCGMVWAFSRLKINDYVYLTMEGLAYRLSSETGLLPWDTINEIRLIKQGYLIQEQNRSLIIRVEIEPTSAPQVNFIKGLFSNYNYRYAKELIDHIQQLAPHAYYRRSFMQRDIFSKE